MAYKSGKSKVGTKRRRKYKSKRFGLPMYRGISRVNAIAPGRLVVTLPYAETFSMSTVASVPGSTVFRANSCFDPDFTGGGHQPRGFDQYTAMYGHARVLKSKIKFDFVANSGNTRPLLVQSTISTQNSTVDTVEALESSRNQCRIVSAPDGGHSQDCIIQYHNPRENFNHDESAEIFNAGADCAYQTYYVLQVSNVPTSNTTTQNLDCVVTIWYTIEFTDIQLPAIS